MSRITFSIWLAELGGIGKSPFAPGTAATMLAGIPAAYLLSFAPLIWVVVILFCLFLTACYVSEITERQVDRIDPKEIVIDELLGYLVTVAGFPLGWKSLLIGLLLFRLFDIFKPWPVNRLNKETPGGIWVVLDDVGAGCYARCFLWIILAIWP